MVTLSEPLLRFKNEGLHYLQPGRKKLFPELEEARTQRQKLERAPQVQYVLQQAQQLLENSAQIPQTNYTAYRMFRKSGERDSYQLPYFLKRARLSAGALRLFLLAYPQADRKQEENAAQPLMHPDSNNFIDNIPKRADEHAPGGSAWKDMVQDYIWNICEESNWVHPAHEDRPIDLGAAETGFLLAETLLLLEDTLDEEVRHRVRVEIERRIFDPYLRFHHLHDWYLRGSNWNGVCNSSIAATFLLLEEEPERLKRALEIALVGLDAFLDMAFAEDGSSTEGVSYWQYGLINFIALSEFLYALSDGAIDLLATEKMKRIATFPLKLQLSSGIFASFADCEEHVPFYPGVITRLAKRTGEGAVLNLLAGSAMPESDGRLTMKLRDILWWDGDRPAAITPTDIWLPTGGTARLVAHLTSDLVPVLSVKAGHNDEQHNHNDIGSFLLHVMGENVLTDPGAGLYSRDYFSARRYENIFANSYGHSVPRIDGALQGAGRAFAGKLVEVTTEGKKDSSKYVALEFAAAYSCPDLKSAWRELRLSTEEAGEVTLWLHDTFTFGEDEHEVEEAFMTWQECEVDGAMARIYGPQTVSSLMLEHQPGRSFQLEYLEEQSRANRKSGVLKRLSITLPRGKDVEAVISITVHKR